MPRDPRPPVAPGTDPSDPGDPDPGALQTPSLRRRVTLVVVLLLAVMLAVLGVTTDLVLRNRLEGQLEQRMLDRAQVGVALADQVEPSELARRLEGNGISVWISTADGTSYTAGPPPVAGPGGRSGGPGQGATAGSKPRATPPAKPAASATSPVVRTGDLLEVTRTLPNAATLSLSADAGEVRRLLDQTRIALLAGALAVLLLATLVIRPVVGRVLRPLDRITGLARSIREGDRGQRLRPDRPGTELGTTAQAFDEMLDAVEGAEEHAVESEARLRGFLSDAAHELRTPIAGIQAAAEHVLRANPERAEREQTLLTLVRESRRAGRLVDDMLLMARIDRGLDLRPTTVDLTQVAGAAVEARRLTHPDARLVVVGEPLALLADGDRVAQVIGNLLDNALRAAGPQGSVRVEIGCEAGQEGGRAVVEVVDDGPGIPRVGRERVFERLVRLDPARSGTDTGAGLGLPIARGIARAHGGDLLALEPRPAAEDSPGHGARFRLTLPLS